MQMKQFLIWCGVLGSFHVIGPVWGVDPIEQARALLRRGDAKGAADHLVPATQWPGNSPSKWEVLVLMGEALEQAQEGFNTEAETRCYRQGHGGAACMERYVQGLNAKYGAGAFEYLGQLNVLRYTGSHYREVARQEGGAELIAEAAYRLLEKNVIGRPDEVLPRVQVFLQRHGRSPWARKARLLWARLHEDIWWIHRHWAWLLYNWQYSEDELIVRGEKYRQEALRAFQALMKDRRSAEGKAARREYELLKAHQTDGVLYGIVNEAMIGGAKGR